MYMYMYIHEHKIISEPQLTQLYMYMYMYNVQYIDRHACMYIYKSLLVPLFQLHPKEIARQLTLIMAENFRSIHPSELVDASWMKEKKKETASPNLLKHTRFETMVHSYCIYTVHVHVPYANVHCTVYVGCMHVG